MPQGRFPKPRPLTPLHSLHECPLHLTIPYEEGNDGWIVSFIPEVPGVFSQGRTKEEAREMALDALAGMLALRAAGHEPQAKRSAATHLALNSASWSGSVERALQIGSTLAMSYSVFISHASHDRWVAGQIAKELGALGADCFLDSQALETGDPLDTSLKKALGTADELLVLLTPTALERPYVWLEIGAAWGAGTRIAGILHGITTSELAASDGTPAFMKGIVLRDIDDFERYAEEVKQRLEEHDDDG